jgi:ABC-type glycerol-3-phosphate transport system substrate-binding protein
METEKKPDSWFCPGSPRFKGFKIGYHRSLRIAGLLALLVLGLAACDLPLLTPEAIPPTAEPTASIELEPTTTLEPGVTPVVFWEPFALDRPQGLLLSEMVRDFEAENPDIDVEVGAKNGYLGIHDAMLAQLPDGDLPDLAVAFPSMIAEYAAAGVVAPLDPYINDPEIGLTETDRVDIFPGFLEAGRLPGQGRQMLAFPFSQNAIGMWVNQTLLEQAGWDRAPRTWAEFEQACYDVSASTGVACYPFVESVSTFNAWLYSRAGQQLDDSGRQATFNGPAGVESLNLLRRLMDTGLAWRPDQTYGDYVAFANGQAAFTFSSTGNSSLYADAYDGALRSGVPPFRWRQTMIPQSDPANPATALYGANFFVVRSDPAREEAAWRLIQWFTDTPQTARWAADLQSMPVRLSALDWMTDTLEAYPFFQAQVEQILPYGRPEPAVAAELEIRDILYTAILSVTQGLADPQTALDEAARDANAVLSGQP